MSIKIVGFFVILSLLFVKYGAISVEPILRITPYKSDSISYRGSSYYLYVFHDVTYVDDLSDHVYIRILLNEIYLSSRDIEFLLSDTDYSSYDLLKLDELNYDNGGLFSKFKVTQNNNNTVTIDCDFKMIGHFDKSLIIKIPIDASYHEINASAWITEGSISEFVVIIIIFVILCIICFLISAIFIHRWFKRRTYCYKNPEPTPIVPPVVTPVVQPVVQPIVQPVVQPVVQPMQPVVQPYPPANNGYNGYVQGNQGYPNYDPNYGMAPGYGVQSTPYIPS